jgi:DNA-binding LacI/PurR family transcriptional regulator
LTDERFVPKLLRELAADGLLINYIADIPLEMDRLIRQHRIPSVWMNTRVEADCVFPDDRRNAAAATRRLLELGHTRIAYLDLSISSHYSVTERAEGYADAMAEAGLAPRLFHPGDVVDPDNRQACCAAFLETPDRPTAVLTYEAYHAVPLYAAALRAGLDVPGDLSIMTFHHQPVDALGVRMDTAEIPAVDMGKEAVRMLYQRIDQPGLSLPPCPLPGRIVPGSTCAAPRHSGERNSR